MPACRSLKIAYQSGPVSLSIAATAPLLSLAPDMLQAESSVAVRSVIGPRIDCARSRRAAAYCLRLSRLHADHQPRDAIVLVGLRDALGILHRFVDVAVDQQRQEGAIEQLAVFRVALERLPVIGGGGRRIALLAGMAGREIAARGGNTGKLLRGRRLRGKCDRYACKKRGKRGAGDAPGEARRSHWRCSNEAGRRGIRASRRGWAENGLFAPLPQERPRRRSSDKLENLDVAASWPEPAAAYHIFG